MSHLLNILVRKVETEKASRAQEGQKLTLEVDARATKPQIRQALKSLYKAEVESVNIVRLPAKTRLVRRGKTIDKRSEVKRAIVTLKSGASSLDLASLSM